MELKQLAAPFPQSDVEFRISSSGMSQKSGSPYCKVLAYLTARAVQTRLDDVCGAENWRTESPRIIDLHINGEITSAFALGLSIRVNDEWITKYDVCELSDYQPVKGGYSGAMKRVAASGWAIGRYLYGLPETWAEVSFSKPPIQSSKWHYARLPPEHGSREIWWQSPSLPAWALPGETAAHPHADNAPSLDQGDDRPTKSEVTALKNSWKAKFAESVQNRDELRDGFAQFVLAAAGKFDTDDYRSWTRDAINDCGCAIVELPANPTEKPTEKPAPMDPSIPF